MERWFSNDDKDVLWIMKQNLKETPNSHRCRVGGKVEGTTGNVTICN